MLKKSIITLSGLATALYMADPLVYGFNKHAGLPTAQKCEAQIFAVAKEQKITVNGQLNYNPWLRKCNFKYGYDYSKNEAKTHSWHPFLR